MNPPNSALWTLGWLLQGGHRAGCSRDAAGGVSRAIPQRLTGDIPCSAGQVDPCGKRDQKCVLRREGHCFKHQRRQRRRKPQRENFTESLLLAHTPPFQRPHCLHRADGETEAEQWGWRPGAPCVRRASAGEALHLPPGDTWQGCCLEAKAQGLGPRARREKAGFLGASRGSDKACRLRQRRGVVETHLANSGAELAGPAPPLGRRRARGKQTHLCRLSPGMLLKKELGRNPWKCFDIWI